MDALLLVGVFVIICFGFVLLFGPPYLPTLNKQSRIALEMINLKPGQVLIELGCGDGKILKAAAATGVHAVGIELNPLLVIVARIRTWRQRKYVRVVWGNFWHINKWPEADGMFVFLLPRHMVKLDGILTKWHKKPVKLVSFAFPIPGKEATKSSEHGVYLYEYT